MKKTKKNKNIKGSKTISLRVCVLQILLEDYFKDSSDNFLFNDKGYPMRIIICLPLKLKSADNVDDREEKLNTSHVKTLFTCTYRAIYESPYYAKYICFTFSLYHSSVTHNEVGV